MNSRLGVTATTDIAVLLFESWALPSGLEAELEAWRPPVSVPATYRSGMVRVRASAIGQNVAQAVVLRVARSSNSRLLLFRLRSGFDETSRSVPQAGSQFRGCSKRFVKYPD